MEIGDIVYKEVNMNELSTISNSILKLCEQDLSKSSYFINLSNMSTNVVNALQHFKFAEKKLYEKYGESVGDEIVIPEESKFKMEFINKLVELNKETRKVTFMFLGPEFIEEVKMSPNDYTALKFLFEEVENENKIEKNNKDNKINSKDD